VPSTFETATVADAMRPGVLSCAPEIPAPIVARMMTTYGIHAVVVTDIPDAGRRDEPVLCGVITDLGLLRVGPRARRERGAETSSTHGPEGAFLRANGR
jgi:hypothetical protein